MKKIIIIACFGFVFLNINIKGTGKNTQNINTFKAEIKKLIIKADALEQEANNQLKEKKELDTLAKIFRSKKTWGIAGFCTGLATGVATPIIAMGAIFVLAARANGRM